ncbi:MAG: S9 family peptidase, partial [Novosphingobium sp.]|nr:S9 family peptidase [Novosphingobium sp.]
MRAENTAESVGVPLSSGGGSASIPTRLTLQRNAYPATRSDGLIEQPFGERVADPFRWLEADPRKDADVSKWVTRQNALSADYLASLPGRDRFAARIRSMFDFERYGLPRKAGSRYFYSRNSGLQNQSALWVRKGVDGEQKLLLDPNTWSADGSLALAQWEPSPSGRFLAFAEQEAGSDWRTLRVVDV